MARRTASGKRRGATPAIEPRIRDEIGAIAVLAFALLSTVALATDQGAVLQWWRSALFALLGWAAWLVPLALGATALELWFGFIRRETVLPILGGIVIIVALLGLTRQVMRADAAGGVVGGAVAKAAGSLFGEVGAYVALGALLLVGLVVAANRTIAELFVPIWRQRPAIGGLKPGTLIPGGTATRFDRFGDDGDDEPDQMRIHIPEAKLTRPATSMAAQLPKPSLRDEDPPASGRAPVAAALSDDLSLALAARTLRIEAPIPGKSVVGIEIPNLAIGLVSVRDVAESAEFKGSPSKLTVALGKDVAGGAIVTDLAKLPHLLIAGQTGS